MTPWTECMIHSARRLRGAINAKDIGLFLVVGLLIGNVGLMTWYLFYGYQSGFHSDSAAKVLLAREIIETGQYFPHDWNYANGDLFVLFGHTFIIPFLAFLPAGFFVHALSGLISAALILSGVWFLTSLFKIGKLKRVVIAAVMAAGISGFMAENLYGQVSYGYVFYSTCYVIYFAWQFLSFNGPKKSLFGVGLFLVLILAFWSNPLRAGLAYCLPLLYAIAYHITSYSFINIYSSREVCASYQLVAIVFLSAVVGTALHFITLHSVNNVLAAGHPRWLSYEEIIRNLTLTPKGFLAIFGGLPSAGGVLVSISGMYEAVRLILALALFALIPLSLRSALQQMHSGSQFVASFALGAVLLVLFIQLTTTVPDMADPVQSSRYLIPALLLLLIVTLARTYEFKKNPLLALFSFSLPIVLIVSAYPTFVRSNSGSGMNWGMLGQHHNHLKNLKDFLLTNGLHYGYASYWNAGVISVISNEKVLVRQIGIDHGLPMPMRLLSSNRWYRSSAWQGETFLLLTAQEASLINWGLLEDYHAKPVRELKFEGFKVFVFAQNLAIDLPGWDSRYEEPASFPVSKESLRQVGKFHENYENAGGALVAEKGHVGALHYGPYILVEPGNYTVEFNVAAESAPSAAVRLDVASSPDQNILAESFLIDNTAPKQLNFTLDKLSTLEFRVWSLGNAKVVFRGVSIVRNSQIKNEQ